MWNPFRKLKRDLKLKRELDKVLDEVEKAKDMKSIFTSKTFWLNLIIIINELLKLLPDNTVPTVPNSVVAGVLPAANILLRRYATKEPVTWTGKV